MAKKVDKRRWLYNKMGEQNAQEFIARIMNEAGVTCTRAIAIGYAILH